ncbi:MAG: hypothetical protein MUF81_18215, partial [Verrucomicrobia bacterium]|nr:hypothetical protein [Verrucomicrobiota bacterium]
TKRAGMKVGSFLPLFVQNILKNLSAAKSDSLLVHWTAHPEPLYKAGGNPSGLDKQYAHKISLVYNPKNETFYLYYCAVGNKGRGIGLITSKPLPSGHSIP